MHPFPTPPEPAGAAPPSTPIIQHGCEFRAEPHSSTNGSDGPCLPVNAQAIPSPDDGFDITWVRCVVPELPPQRKNVHSDGVRKRVRMCVPDVLQQGFLTDHLTRVPYEVLENAVL